MDCGRGELPATCSALGCRNARALLFMECWLENIFIFCASLGNALPFASHMPELTQLEVVPESFINGGERSLLTLWCPWVISVNETLFVYLPLDLSVLRPETRFWHQILFLSGLPPPLLWLSCLFTFTLQIIPNCTVHTHSSHVSLPVSPATKLPTAWPDFWQR